MSPGKRLFPGLKGRAWWSTGSPGAAGKGPRFALLSCSPTAGPYGSPAQRWVPPRICPSRPGQFGERGLLTLPKGTRVGVTAVGDIPAGLRVVPLGHLFCAWAALPPLCFLAGWRCWGLTDSWRRSGPRRAGPGQLLAGRRDSSQDGRGGASLAPRGWLLLGWKSCWARSLDVCAGMGGGG